MAPRSCARVPGRRLQRRRSGLDRLRDAVKAREVDRVLVTAPDRLARNYVTRWSSWKSGRVPAASPSSWTDP
nr:recombinase family protein [Methylobacterium isbiliense]